MKYDATLKKLFQRPPNRLLSHVLGAPTVIRRVLPTDRISTQNLDPDLLFETADGQLIHAELQGYAQPGSPAAISSISLLCYATISVRRSRLSSGSGTVPPVPVTACRCF